MSPRRLCYYAFALLLVAALVPAHAADDATLVAKGEYLARIGDCAACHTAQGGEPFAGGRGIPTPFGAVYAPNITPDRTHGIGAWSADDFWRALHEGVAPGGMLLYPAFPYTSYTYVTREDADAIYAYLRSVKPSARKDRENALRFPYNVRALLLGWQGLYFKPATFEADPKRSPAWNRGAYLVQGLGHCAACHSPRNAMGATDADNRYAGGLIPAQDWYAPSLNSAEAGLGTWSEDEITALLKTGRSTRGATFGPMSEVVFHSLQYLTDADAHAIATYLKSLPQQPEPRSARDVYVSRSLAARLTTRGAEIYRKECAGCHGDRGEGVAGIYPPLANNQAVTARVPANPIRIVMQGSFQVATAANPRPYSMPSFADRMSDADVAAVVTYIRASWGNKGRAVLPDEIKLYRSGE